MDRAWAKRVSLVAVAVSCIFCAAMLFGCTRFDGAVDFTADLTSGRKPLSVRFSPALDGGVRRWVWNFGDGQTSTERSPEHTYVDAGTYTVLLTVFPRYGDPVTVAKVDYVTVTSGMGGGPQQLVALDDAYNVAEMTVAHDTLGSWFVFDVLANDTAPDPEAELTILGVRDDEQPDYDMACILESDCGVVRVSTGKLAPAGKRVLFMEHDAGWGIGDLTFYYLVSDGHTTAEATVTISDHDTGGHPMQLEFRGHNTQSLKSARGSLVLCPQDPSSELLAGRPSVMQERLYNRAAEIVRQAVPLETEGPELDFGKRHAVQDGNMDRDAYIDTEDMVCYDTHTS